MKGIPDNYLDLVFADPPAQFDSDNAFNRKLKRNYDEWIQQIMSEANRILKPGGHLITLTSLSKKEWVKSELQKYSANIGEIKWHTPEYHPKGIYEYILITNSNDDLTWENIPLSTSQKEFEDCITQLPKMLVSKIILAYSNSGDIIYDMFSGSGVMLKVAKDHHREFIGTEINGDLVKRIRKELKT